MKKMKKIISRILVLIIACLSLVSVANAAEKTATEVQITIEGKQESSVSDPEDEETNPEDEDRDIKSEDEDKGADNEQEDVNPEKEIPSVQTGDGKTIYTYIAGLGVALAVIAGYIWKRKKKNRAFLIAMGILFSSILFQHNALPAEASDVAENVNVTVPSVVSVVFDEEGKSSIREFSIENHTYAPVTIERVQATECNDWQLVSKGQAIPANTKQLVFELEELCLQPGENEANIKVAANASKKLNIEVERGAWSQDKTAETALRLVFYYEVHWEETSAYAVYCEADRSLNFYRSVEPIQAGTIYRGKQVTQVYTGFEEATYDWGQAPWYEVRTKVDKVEFHDPIQPVSLSYWFLEFYNVNYADMTKLDTSCVTSMDYMCKSMANWASELEMKGLEGWDVSNLKSMNMAFGYVAYNAQGPVTIGDLSNWDVSNVTNMTRAFSDVGYYTSDFTLCGFENWDTGNVTHMSSMFQRTGKYDPDWFLDLSGWNVSKVTNHIEFNLGVENKVTQPNWVQ